MSFKKILKILLFSLIALVGLSVLIGALFSKQIGRTVLADIQRHLKTEMKVGDFNIELFSAFPSASLNFKKVRVKDIRGHNLLEADKIAFRFGLFSLFKDHIDIKSILVDNGALYLSYDRKGRPNYDIVKSSGTSSSSSKAFAIRKATLSDLELIYEDEKADRLCRAVISDAVFSGLFSASRFNMKTHTNGVIAFYETGGKRYLEGADIGYDAELVIDLDRDTYRFKHGDLFFADSEFGITGKVQNTKRGVDFDLALNARDAALASLFRLLPKEAQQKLYGVKTTGKLRFDGTVKGLLSARSSPDLNFRFGVHKGKIYGGKLTTPVRNFSFNGRYTSVGRHAALKIPAIKAMIKDRTLRGKLVIKDIKRKPYVDCSLQGVLPVALLTGFLGDETLTGEGNLSLNNCSIQGALADLKNTRTIARAHLSGQIGMDDTSLSLHNQKITIDKGAIQVKGNKLIFDGVKLDGVGEDIHIKGSLEDYLPVLLADSSGRWPPKLHFDFNIEAKEVDVKAFLALVMPDTAGESKDDEEKKVHSGRDRGQRDFAQYLDGKIVIAVDRFSYDDIQGSDFEGKLVFDGEEVSLTGDADGMEGSFGIEGVAHLSVAPRMDVLLVVSDVDVREFFRQTHNFGQQFITYRNLKGKMDARIIIHAFWDEKGNFLTDRLTALAEMHIRNGELIRFKMMENFASFVKVQDLRHIRFKDLTNWMEIKKSKVYIPTMFIQSNAANLFVAGQHSFDNKIAYNIKVNAAQILANKFRRHTGQIQPAHRKGWFNLYYTIRGTTDKFTYKTDKRTVKKVFQREENRKKRIRRELKKEFGDTPVKITAYLPSSTADDEYLPDITPDHSSGDAPGKMGDSPNAPGGDDEVLIDFDGEIEL